MREYWPRSPLVMQQAAQEVLAGQDEKLSE